MYWKEWLALIGLGLYLALLVASFLGFWPMLHHIMKNETR